MLRWIILGVIKQLKTPKKFNVTIPLTQSFIGNSEDSRVLLEGLASNTNRSETGHKMKKSAIKMMKESGVGLPIFVNHNPDQVAGKIIEVKDGSDTEFSPVSQLFSLSGNAAVDAPVTKVLHWIENDLDLGMSIGGNIIDADLVKLDNGDYGVDVNSIKLLETSITPIPAVQETKGKLKKCDQGVCSQIIQQFDFNTDFEVIEEAVVMAEKNENVDVNELKQEIKGLSEGLKLIMEERQAELKQKAADEVAAAKKAEQDALLESVDTKIQEGIKSGLEEVVKGLKSDRNHTQASNVVNEDVKTELEKDESGKGVPVDGSVLGQSYNNPLEYPSHIGGIAQVGLTPDELVQKL